MPVVKTIKACACLFRFAPEAPEGPSIWPRPWFVRLTSWLLGITVCLTVVLYEPLGRAAMNLLHEPGPHSYRALTVMDFHFHSPEEHRFLPPTEHRFQAPEEYLYHVDAGQESNATSFFAWAADEYGLPRALLSAIAYQESMYNPFALNVEGRSYHPKNRHEAIRIINKSRGKSYDVGVMQINSYWIRKHKLDPLDLLEPEINIRWGAWILWNCCKRYGVNWRGVAAYHTGNPDRLPGRAVSYATKVIRHMERIDPTAMRLPRPKAK